MKLDLRIDEVFPQPPQRLGHAHTDSRVLARWLMSNDFIPVVGHRFTLRGDPQNGWRGWVDCEVLELEPPRRMVWSWHGGREGEAVTRVTFELHAEGGGTRLLLRHAGEALPIQHEGLSSGWPLRITRLHDELRDTRTS
jgi:uncharacterized protein YndB with AHSA1/START domain